jgi:vacuolar-type H+-ATPase subunit C/Vma6
LFFAFFFFSFTQFKEVTSGAQDITEKPLSNFDLPPPPSKEQILGNIEQIKKQYWQQVDEWNKHMDTSKRDADERLTKMLAQYKKTGGDPSLEKRESIDHSK